MINTVRFWNIFFLTIMYFGFVMDSFDQAFFITNNISIIRYILIIISFVYYIIVYLIKNKFTIKLPRENKSRLFIMFWYIFALSLLVASVVKFNFPFSFFGYGVLIPIVFFMVIPHVLYNPLEDIFISLSIASNWAVLLSIIKVSPLQDYSLFGTYYRGITLNSNNMGIIAFCASISLLIILIESYRKNVKRKWLVCLLIVLLVVSLYVLFITGTRTVMLALLIGLLVVFLVHFIIKQTIQLWHLLIASSLLIILLIFGRKLYESLTSYLSYKVQVSDSVLNGRSQIWIETIKDYVPFGHGENYFQEVRNIEAHNVFIQYFGESGMIVAIMFLVIAATSLVLAYLFMINGNRSLSYVPLFYIVSFLIICNAESLLGVFAKPPTMVYYSILGILIYNLSKKEANIDENIDNNTSL